MGIKLLQQSTFRRYAAIVLSPFSYFCCFRCVIVPLTGVINYVFNYVFCIYIYIALLTVLIYYSLTSHSDDDTWPSKVNIMIPIYLWPISLTTAIDTELQTLFQWSTYKKRQLVDRMVTRMMTSRHVTLKVQSRYPNTVRAQYLKNG